MIRSDGSLRLLPRIVVIAVLVLGLIPAGIDVFTLLFFVGYGAVGAFLAVRRARNAVGWLLIAIAFAFIGTSTPSSVLENVIAGRVGFGDQVVAWIGSWTGTAIFLAFAVLAATFPDGHLPAIRARSVVRGTIVVGAIGLLLSLVAPTVGVSADGQTTYLVRSPIAFLPESEAWELVGQNVVFVELLVLAVCIGTLLGRYRSATETVRLQIRWLLAAVSLVLVSVVIGLVLTVLAGEALGGLVWVPAILSYPTVPLAILVAILRYRLYEIDRILNRALVYGLVTAILAGTFAAASAVSQQVFIAVTGASSDLGVVLTTLLVAAFYAPVRRSVERVVDRRFKYDSRQFGPYRDELGRLADLVVPGRVAARIAREAISETRAAAAVVVDGAGAIVGASGKWPEAVSRRVVIGDGSGPLSAILLAPRADRRPFDEKAIRALSDVASLAVAVMTSTGAWGGARVGTGNATTTAAAPAAMATGSTAVASSTSPAVPESAAAADQPGHPPVVEGQSVDAAATA